MKKQVIASPDAPEAIGPYVQAVRVGDLVFTAGQIALDPETMTMVERDITVQTHRVLKNLKAVLKEAGSGMKHVVKTTVFLADLNDYAAVNAVYAEYLGDNPPARSAIQVAKLPLDSMVEIEAVALVKKKKKKK